jgi:pimeloyl-ACP methyl ester carboxylesterase
VIVAHHALDHVCGFNNPIIVGERPVPNPAREEAIVRMKGTLRTWRLAAVLAALVGVIVSPDKATAQGFTEERGTLLNGTPYLIRVPDPLSNWNRVLISDLDFIAASNGARSLYWLGQGYALSGTNRRSDRRTNYNPAMEIADLVTVLDLFEARFGRANRVLQYGHSGGGHVALAMAEVRPDRIDGAVAGCAHTPVWLMNMLLDGWFVLKALLAPELPIVSLPNDHSAMTTAWRAVINAAQQTPEGRARIALAVTVGQWPAWSSATTPQPDPTDVDALQHSMYETVFANAGQPGGQSRFMFEAAGGGGQLSWNTDVDYRKLFDGGHEFSKQAVRKLYRTASLDLKEDLARINAFPRVAADAHALDFWSVPGRTVHGEPRVPVLRIHTIGDSLVPVTIVQGYDAAVRANGNQGLYRTAFVERPGHCTFSVGESAAAIETLMRRLDTGRWEATTHPKQLNELAESLVPGTPLYIKFQPDKLSRPWFPKGD